MLELLKTTPWWVYPLFVYLIITGIQAVKRRVISLRRLFLVPAIFVLWAFVVFPFNVVTFSHVFFWLLSIGTGMWIGERLVRSCTIKADKKRALLTTPGGPTMLILVILMFAIRYLFGYAYALSETVRQDMVLVLSDLFAAGLMTGVFLGRALCLFYKWKKADHTDLHRHS